MFKNHLEMIGRNETPSKKAKFWQSYVRSLKGSDDIRAHDSPKIRSWRPWSAYVDTPPNFRSIFANPETPAERITSHGYRYLPVHRETYGYSPRPIYDHHYSRTIPLANYDVERAWNEHLKRMSEIERRYPSRYGLYLKDWPNAVVPQEYEPEDKPLFAESARASSVPPIRPFSRARSSSPFLDRLRASSVEPGLDSHFSKSDSDTPLAPRRLRASSLDRVGSLELDLLFSKYDRLLDYRSHSPTPVKPGRWAPREPEVAYDSDGLPIYHGAFRRNNFDSLLNPSPRLPITAITRDPWWWDIEDLRPYRLYPYRALPPYLRDSYLSPVKRTYLWDKHPIRPFAHAF
ncbi:unnamed protein product [Hermetia illucens]|uniref:Myofilin n=1 Tax=Hermetia illucens TaxID=343691 RepID=A0A7R8V4S6_HERIL|nr:uncharacterized protein LOC119660112 [Hermetia illucens]CAD7092668.1 unnamed protein product [Hermetia illucens]